MYILPLKSGCHVFVVRKVFVDALLTNLMEECDNTPLIGGKTSYGTKIRRLQKYFQDDGIYFSNCWKEEYPRWVAHDFPDWLNKLMTKIQFITQIYIQNTEKNIRVPEFNSSLINLYRDGNDVIRAHRDSQELWGEFPIISSLSLGESRVLRFQEVEYDPSKPKSMKSKKTEPIDITLSNGDMLVMYGETQLYYAHSLLPSDTKNKRYNLTFRHIVTEE